MFFALLSQATRQTVKIEFACGPIDGILGLRTRKALAEFQKSYELKTTGAPDSTTRAQLVKRHGSLGFQTSCHRERI
jgi:peptidoglycan hydrolase-like protein with peptidoglycan-binding domain